MTLRNKRLYHGTSKKIKGDYLRPSISCRTFSNGKTFKRCDRIPKVYTTSSRDVALLFSANIPARNAKIQKDGRVFFFIKKKDLNRFKGPGWIYEVEKKGFKKGPRTKYDEYVNTKRVKIIKKIRVPNLYKHIMKNPNIVLVMR